MTRYIAFSALLVAGTSLQAAEVLKKVPLQLDMAKAYVLLELHDVNAMGSSNVPGGLVLARYDPIKSDVRGGARSPDTAVAKGEAVRVTITKNPLVKNKDSRLYLLALEPDSWVIEGSGGTAFSLGSNSFVAKAGTITDLGVIAPSPDWREGENAKKEFKRAIVGALLFGGFAKRGDPTPYKASWHVRGPQDIAVPVELAPKIQSVEFSKGVKFGNYLGGLVNRIDGRVGRPTDQEGSAESVLAKATPPDALSTDAISMREPESPAQPVVEHLSN